MSVYFIILHIYVSVLFFLRDIHISWCFSISGHISVGAILLHEWRGKYLRRYLLDIYDSSSVITKYNYANDFLMT